jgi:hypothetical protein
MLTAPAYAPYVFVINFFLFAYVVPAGLKRKIAAPLERGTVIVKLNTKPCQAKNAFAATQTDVDPANPRD